ncbi:MAG: chromosome segregation protein SMC [Candidatus Eisenbacteria bacterium]|nr:chromosome segregation protein SMC [Candidatus Eisenbacteria bacterium]
MVILEKLELFGFKSFAERTQIRFSPGITAVVGPNGCGKSNISDAVRWALGEQNVRNLRGRTLQDVIFKGTREVKPMGVAEVSLQLDNQSQRLASEYAEVVIRRRAFRSGESEFSINKSPCRLKDIRHLFMDTGLGSAEYAVIEREMIDEVLSDRDKTRRFLLDEASGITRYKQRRHETRLKLEGVERDLTRVEDALEIEQREVRSLAYQMGKTRKYKRLDNAVRELEVALARLRWRDLSATAQGESGRLGEEERQRETVRTEIHRLEAEQEELRVTLLELNRKLEQARDGLRGSEEGLASCHEESLVRQERIRALREQISELEARSAETREAHLRDREEHARIEPSLAQLREARETQERNAREAEAAYRRAERNLNEAKQELQRHQQLHIDSVRRHSDADHRFEACESRLADLTTSRAEIAGQIEALSARVAELEQWLAERRETHAGLQSEREGCLAALHEQERRLREARERLDALEREQETPERERASVASRLHLLEEQARSHEGFRKGVSELLAHRSEIPGVRGAVAHLIDIEPRLAERLAPALAEWTDWIVTDREADAWRAIAWLQERGLGGVTFLPLELLGPAAPRDESQNGAGAPLPEDALLAHEPDLAPLARHLTRRLRLIADATEVPPRDQRGRDRRWITLRGEVIAGEGWVAAAGAADRDLRLWGRTQEIAELRQRLEELARRCETLESQRAAAGAQIRAAEEAAGERRAEADELQLELENHARALLQKEAEERLVREEIRRLSEDEDRLQQRRAALEGERRQLESTRERVVEEGSSTESLFHAATQRVEQETAEKDRCGEALSERKLQALLAATRLQETERALEQLAAEIAEAERQLETMRSQQERARTEIAEAEARLETLAGQESELLAQRETRRGDVNRHEQERGRREDRLEAIERELRARRRSLSEFEEALRENEVRLARIETEKEALRQRFRETYRIDLARLEEPGSAAAARGEGSADAAAADDLDLREPAEVLGELSIEKARERSADLRRQRDRIGPVNPLAIEEYEKKREHVRFITAQRDDLVKSRESLLEAIERINREARQMFSATFAQVQKNLAQTFETLFPGGEARLRLSGDDPLEADVEIMARPRGKRLESIHLLSSGEKALTATALLFALYLVKPSPFCLLDEVDAPLDDANIDRFLNLLRSFSDRTQFVIITHNKRTMEVADSLYGVTMQEPGISKVVSVRLESGAVVAEHADGREAPLAGMPAAPSAP